jgi:hypothetical protein
MVAPDRRHDVDEDIKRAEERKTRLARLARIQRDVRAGTYDDTDPERVGVVVERVLGRWPGSLGRVVPKGTEAG